MIVSMTGFGDATAERDRFSFHLIEQRLHTGALTGGQTEPVTQRKDVRRSRIAVEFGRKRQAHPASGLEVRDLLIGECLDGTALHS